jgi:hypothetical protein
MSALSSPAADLVGADHVGADLVDAHCHSVTVADLDDAEFAMLCTESSLPPAPGTSYLHTPLMLAIRRWCAPALGLERHAPIEQYLARRRHLGGVVASRRLLGQAGVSALLVDTGYVADQVAVPELAELAGARGYEVVRLESLAEELAPAVLPHQFPQRFRHALRICGERVVAFKSVLAYRHGFDVAAERPSDDAVIESVTAWSGEWAASRSRPVRVTDPVILRFLLWEGLTCPQPAGRKPRPVQLHAGYGDADLDLHRANPLLLTDLIRAVLSAGGGPIVLLHCYPFHREAAYLASVYPHVYFDIGVAVGHLGPSASTLVAEALELAPFGKLHFSSDGCALAELFLVGALAFRHGLDKVLGDWVRADEISAADAASIRATVLGGTARRLYPGLDGGSGPGPAFTGLHDTPRQDEA